MSNRHFQNKLRYATICALATLTFSTVSRAEEPAATPAPQAAAAEPAAQVGKPAPDFTLTDQDGKAVKLSDLGGKVVVLEWINPKCPFVVRHYKAHTMTSLQKKYKSDKLVWLRINSTNSDHREYVGPKDIPSWAKENGVNGPVLDDQAGVVGQLYGAKTTPHMFVIDEKGVLVYSGAIDDDPRGEKEPGKRVNYVDAILASWKSGKGITPSANDSYGCSVKYRK